MSRLRRLIGKEGLMARLLESEAELVRQDVALEIIDAMQRALPPDSGSHPRGFARMERQVRLEQLRADVAVAYRIGGLTMTRQPYVNTDIRDAS